MADKKYNLFRYIAGAIFIVQIILFLISGSVGGSNLLKIIANVIMAVSLLTKKDKLFALGIGACILHSIGSIIEYVRFVVSVTGISFNIPTILAYCNSVNSYVILSEVISIIIFALILIAIINADKYQKLAVIVVVLLFAGDIIPEMLAYGFSGIISGIIVALFSSIPMSLAVIAILNNHNSQPIRTKKATAPVLSASEKLTKLKSLLDMGVITQEEFDAKKKELLNL